MKKRNAAYWLFLLPSLLGVLVFYVVPFGYSLWVRRDGQHHRPEFCGLKKLCRHPLQFPVP